MDGSDDRAAPTLGGVNPDTVPEGVFTTDVAGRITSWNTNAERITGWPRKDALGKPCSLLAGNSVTGCTCGTGPVRCGRVQAGRATSTTCTITARDGRPVLVVKNVVALRGATGEIVGSLETFTDVRSASAAPAARPSAPPRAGDDFCGMVGSSGVMKELFQTVALVAQSGATVMITGETGTGKECVASAIHQLSPRHEKPFVRVNCSALNENLLESELFGHVRGAFTGALRDRRGRFEEAHGGTLFLDEIGDLSPGVQVKLLRSLEQRQIERVGDSRPIQIDVRLLFATNRDLRAMVARGDFRADLFFRINVFPIHVPSLAQRREDVAPLAQALLARHEGAGAARFAKETLELLSRYSWPGNVRELCNAVEYSLVRAGFGEILPTHLPADLLRQLGVAYPANPAVPARAAAPAPEEAETKEREMLRALLETHGWSRTATAQALGVSRVTLWKRMRRLKLAR